MKPVLAFLITLAAAIATVGAQANGSPYSPGLVQGGNGVLAPNQDVRYVTLATGTVTSVAAIRVRGGRVLRTWTLRGFYGIPIVAYDGTTGGLSGDSRSLVVSSYGPLPGTAGSTTFMVLGTKTLRPRSRVELTGSWSYDASSPDGKTVYLVEHLSAGRNPRYRVRVFDLERGKLLPEAIVDRLEKESVMGGEPVTRASSSDGRWAYTLYARRSGEPFVHALDTARREAFCIDLPLDLAYDDQRLLRLRLREPREALAVRRRNGTLATIDTRSWDVRPGG